MMAFLVDFLQGWWHRISEKDDQRLHLKYFMVENFKNTYLLQTTNLTISSSKQSFEEETSLSIIDDENLEIETYFEPPSGLLVLLVILRTKSTKP